MRSRKYIILGVGRAIQSLDFCAESIWKQHTLIKALHIPECKGSHDYFKIILSEYRAEENLHIYFSGKLSEFQVCKALHNKSFKDA